MNLTLFGMAEAVNPGFLWLKARGADAPLDGSDPALLGWLPEDRLMALAPPRPGEPSSGITSSTTSRLIAEDEPPRNVNRLLAFLRLPDGAQRVLSAQPTAERPGVLAVPDPRALTHDFSPPEVEAIIDAHGHAGYSLFVGFSEQYEERPRTPGPGRNAFDFVFRIDEGPAPNWERNRLLCEKAPAEGPYHTGSGYGLIDLPFLATTFRRAPALP